MSFLLDTHTFIWFINGDKQLPGKVQSAIADTSNKCFLSIASVWEIAIKSSLGKLKLKADFSKIADFLNENDIESLPISFEHTLQLTKMQYVHRDPFDRIIIAQGITEKLTIITDDGNFSKYPVKTSWNR